MRLVLTWLLLAATATPAEAQWYVALEWFTHGYGGSSRDTSGAHPTAEGSPGGGGGLAFRAGRQGHRMGVAIRAAFANPGFSVHGQDINLTDRTTGRLLEAGVLVSTRVGGIGPSGAIRAEWGPALHLWDFSGEIRARLGATGGAAYEWPVARRWIGTIRFEAAISKSWFEAAEVPPEFERRLTWRYGLALGIRYRLS